MGAHSAPSSRLRSEGRLGYPGDNLDQFQVRAKASPQVVGGSVGRHGRPADSALLLSTLFRLQGVVPRGSSPSLRERVMLSEEDRIRAVLKNIAESSSRLDFSS